MGRLTAGRHGPSRRPARAEVASPHSARMGGFDKRPSGSESRGGWQGTSTSKDANRCQRQRPIYRTVFSVLHFKNRGVKYFVFLWFLFFVLCVVPGARGCCSLSGLRTAAGTWLVLWGHAEAALLVVRFYSAGPSSALGKHITMESGPRFQQRVSSPDTPLHGTERSCKAKHWSVFL